MKKMLLGGVLVLVATLSLGGCYVAPGYSYVRGPDGGGAYYGRATAVYDDGYYAPYGYGYYSYPYGYPGGVTVGVGTTWYGGSYYRRDYRGDDRRRGGNDYRGHWDRDGHRDGGGRGGHYDTGRARQDTPRSGGGDGHRNGKSQRSRDGRHR